MIPFPNIGPVIIKVGPLSVRWYGIMYLIGFAASYLPLRYQIKKKKIPVNAKEVDSLYSSLVFGLIIKFHEKRSIKMKKQ